MRHVFQSSLSGDGDTFTRPNADFIGRLRYSQGTRYVKACKAIVVFVIRIFLEAKISRGAPSPLNDGHGQIAGGLT